MALVTSWSVRSGAFHNSMWSVSRVMDVHSGTFRRPWGQRSCAQHGNKVTVSAQTVASDTWKVR